MIEQLEIVASRRMELAVTPIQPPELKITVEWNQPQLVSSPWNSSHLCDGISHNSYPGVKTTVSHRTESTATHIQASEYESAVGQNQPQLIFSSQNSSQPLDRIICNLYSAARTRGSSRIESAATLIQPPEFESAVGQNQLQLVSGRQNWSQSQDFILLFYF